MNILVVSPHPDDETLGAGGTLLKYKDNGNKIFWLNISNMKEEYGYDKHTIDKRNAQIVEVKDKYNFDGFYDLALQPACLENYNSNGIIELISNIFKKIQPEVIILPNPTDAHSDHKKVFDWCYACTKVFRYPYVKIVLTMEILSETDFGNIDNNFKTNYFVDISNYFDEKKKIMQIYSSELGNHPFPRSMEGLEAQAKYRGISAGVVYAEAFNVIKIID